MARLLYKCRLCSEVDDSKHCPDNIAPEQSWQIMNNGKTSLKNTFVWKQTGIHSCNKTDVGIADFVGYRLEEE